MRQRVHEEAYAALGNTIGSERSGTRLQRPLRGCPAHPSGPAPAPGSAVAPAGRRSPARAGPPVPTTRADARSVCRSSKCYGVAQATHDRWCLIVGQRQERRGNIDRLVPTRKPAAPKLGLWIAAEGTYRSGTLPLKRLSHSPTKTCSITGCRRRAANIRRGLAVRLRRTCSRTTARRLDGCRRRWRCFRPNRSRCGATSPWRCHQQ